ncbi:MAG TPA: DUF58 domain-containing protein [Planctomycetaceae bacterium]|nr:DUF58 domain-containing protein [Planctomycetaceae bacterium]
MTPRWPLLVLFIAAGAVLAAPPVALVFVDLDPATARNVHWLGVSLNFLIFGAALVDLAVSPSLRKISVEREMSDVMSVGARNAVRIWLTNRNKRTVTVAFQDEPPQPCATDGLPFVVALAPLKARYRVYYVEPHHRGPTRYGDIHLRTRSRFGFWTFFDQRTADTPVKVYPDIQAVHGIELLARKNRVAETGLKLSRLRGRGTEFDRLREYRREDEFRHIDWKATARQQQLISREYVVERNQKILIVLDCGRSMCNELGGISHLDRALNAAIVLSYIALRQGDNVGMLAFSNRTERWVRPVRGAGAIQSIIRHTYDIEPRYEASDYSLMVEELRRRFRKRSLVVLLTHALDELHLGAISRHVRELRSPHLVLAAFLRNVPLYERMQSVPKSDVDAFQIAAAAEMVHMQTRQIAELNHSGLLVLDTLPEQLSADLISRYLDIKARHLL